MSQPMPTGSSRSYAITASLAPELGTSSPRTAQASHTWTTPGAEAVKRVLIIDNEAGLVQTLRQNLELEGHEVLVEPEGMWGVAQAVKFLPDLVITDLAVLEAGGHGLLEQLRSEREDVPVLVLAGRSEEATRLPGFRLGLDDFLVRPVGVTELHRRIDALLRQSGMPAPMLTPTADTSIRFGVIEVHGGSRTVLRDGVPVPLRMKEFDLLLMLASRAGRVVTRMDLLREVWGYRTWVATRTVDTHVAELRRKLEADPANPQHILTVRKLGYRLQR
jgi:two-component system, OmpR family, alkaline phosphatase synthesis response regulator PhoP